MFVMREELFTAESGAAKIQRSVCCGGCAKACGGRELSGHCSRCVPMEWEEDFSNVVEPDSVDVCRSMQKCVGDESRVATKVGRLLGVGREDGVRPGQAAMVLRGV